MVTIYGIKNCDTVKKALKWLAARGLDHQLHDYKKLGVDDGLLKRAIDQHGWELVINRRGTTWRKLPDDIKDAMDAKSAVAIAHDNPSIIKRPIVEVDGTLYLGFNDELYSQIF